ncbi:MAG: chloride channel protein [Gemmatimonadaceae bacterium]|nr:chloride channel protein [Gemmatimonadaceae bacterium]
MTSAFRERVARWRAELLESPVPRLADEAQWYTEHTALLVSTLKWALLGAGGGLCVGLGTRAFLWALGSAPHVVQAITRGAIPAYWLLPVALPLCVWLIRTFAPEARGHGTEAVIAAVHQRSGRIDWTIAPVKLAATVVTLAFGGSVGKEGPAAQIGASITSMFADLLRLRDEDRRRLVICGISAGFAAVFGTPVSGALFGIEVLYLGQLDYSVIFPAMVAGIVAHLACGVASPFPTLTDAFGDVGQLRLILTSIASGAAFGLVALLLIEVLRLAERIVERLHLNRLVIAALGGCALVALYAVVGTAYAGLGTETIDGLLQGTLRVTATAFLVKIVATALTLETGGSGGILTPVFFIGAASGAALAPLFGVPSSLLAAFGFVAVLAAAANTPIAAAVMAIEVLPAHEGVYAALAAVTAFLMVGHRSVYASQKLGFSKSAGLDVALGGTIGELERGSMRIRKGTFTERLHRLGRSGGDRADGDAGGE